MTAAVKSIFQELDEIDEFFSKDLKYLSNEEYKGYCLSCQQPIIGKATTFTINEIKSNFHPGCFKCGNCSLSMEGKGFFLHEGKYLDQECYHKLVLGKCDACSKAFTDLVVVKVRGKQFHPACFTCNKCSTILSATYIENDSKVYCKICYETTFLPPCYSCKSPISPEVGSNKLMAIEWKEKKFHVACFSCKMCTQPFSDLKAILHKDDLLCKPCFEKISAF